MLVIASEFWKSRSKPHLPHENCQKLGQLPHPSTVKSTFLSHYLLVLQFYHSSTPILLLKTPFINSKYACLFHLLVKPSSTPMFSKESAIFAGHKATSTRGAHIFCPPLHCLVQSLHSDQVPQSWRKDFGTSKKKRMRRLIWRLTMKNSAWNGFKRIWTSEIEG